MYKKIVLMILCFLVAISCSNPNSPNTTNTNQTGDTNKVETVTPPGELEKYGVDISQDDDVIASQLESNLKLYFDEKGSYKVILKGIPKDYGFNSTTKSLAYLIFNAANKVGANSVDVDISNIDFKNVFLSGDSSGGHIALLVALQNNYSFKGIIDLYGITNFMTFNDWYSKYDWCEKENVSDFLGSLDEQLLIEASPMTYLKENMKLPPFLILHGDKDHVVPITQSIELYEKLKEYHYEVTFGRVHDADHGRSIFYNEDVYHTIITFLKKHKQD